ncbi:MAG: hypothetical protein PSX36_02745 [bacterium]|nr:hypothetical protein [bacterium]
MKKLIKLKFAGNGLLALLTLSALFHSLVLVGLIPYSLVWGGRIDGPERMQFLETVSLLLNLFMLVIVLLRMDYMKVRIHPKFITLILWLMFALFLVNTIGNLLSQNNFEKMFFSPLTLLLCLFSLRLAIESTIIEASN